MIKKVQFNELFDKDQLEHDIRLKVLNAAKGLKATHVVRFENQQMDASNFGTTTWLSVGPTCTYKTPESVDGQRLGDAPSRFQYPVSYAEVPA